MGQRACLSALRKLEHSGRGEASHHAVLLPGLSEAVQCANRDRHVNEFAGWSNIRCRDTIDQMRAIARGLESRRFRKADVVV